MKKLMTLAVVLSAVAFAQAEETEQKKKGPPGGPKGPVTEEQFLARGQARAEKEGIEFNEAEAKKRFASLDKDGNGEISKEEAPKRRGKDGERGPKNGGEKAPAQ
jgi:hypothetical protein